MKIPLQISVPLASLALAAVSFGQNATTTPVGAVTVTIAASPDGVTYTQTPFSAPLLTSGNFTGQAVGRLTAVTSNTFSNSGAGWVAGALSVAGSPYFINITSGANEGRMFLISSNTDTQLTVNNQGLDLTTAGFVTGASGDSYEIVQGVSLLTLLGSPADGIVGGAASQATGGTIDKVLINDPVSGNLFTCYYDLTNSQWRRVGSATSQNALAISPKAGLNYFRIGTTTIALDFTGTVPYTQNITRIPTSGTALVSPFYPVDATLGSLGIENIVGWRKANDSGVTVANSDRVVVKNGSTYMSFYFDASSAQWKRVGSATNQGNVAIPAGSALRFVRSGTPGGYNEWTRAMPYSLN